MRYVRPILVAVVAVLLAGYAIDCGGMTPEQATQCCNSMPCSSHGHSGEDCCKTMPTMHAPFVKTPAVQATGLSLHVSSVLAMLGNSVGLVSSVHNVSVVCHAPLNGNSASPLQLRI